MKRFIVLLIVLTLLMLFTLFACTQDDSKSAQNAAFVVSTPSPEQVLEEVYWVPDNDPTALEILDAVVPELGIYP